MRIGFSSLVCPTWDLRSIITKAAEWGFQAIELRGLQGELHLPLAPQLAADPAGVRSLLAEHSIELACLGSSVTLTTKNPSEAGRQKASLEEYCDLAHALGCPHVRVFLGEVPRRDTQRAALARVAERLSSIAPTAARLNVTVLIENGGDFPTSNDLWFLLDAVQHPCIRGCWNQCHAASLRERPTLSLPRLGGKLGLVHVCDAEFDDQGVLLAYKPLGEGNVEVAKQIELLKGLMYTGDLVFEWPKLWIESLPAPEAILPGVAKFLRAQVDAKQPILSAYKGDKNAPRFVKPTAPG